MSLCAGVAPVLRLAGGFGCSGELNQRIALPVDGGGVGVVRGSRLDRGVALGLAFLLGGLLKCLEFLARLGGSGSQGSEISGGLI